jgi:hypothetical protein
MTAASLLHHLDLRTALPRADLRLRRLVRGGDTIVVGPWLSEVGFEVLYWLPFLNWFAERPGVDPSRLLAISRGGAGCWYGHACGATTDVFEVFSPDDLRDWSEERRRGRASQKQFASSERDREVVRRVLEHRGIDPERTATLHPSTMYGLFSPVWDGWRPLSRIADRTLNRPIPRPPASALEGELPDDYVAVKVYFSDCFPDTDSNRAFVTRLIGTLAERHEVVLLSTGIRLDDHRDLEPLDQPNVHDLERHMRPVDNLEVQTRAIAGARAFVGTYGGFSYLAPYLGVGSLAFYSEENFAPTHLGVMRRARSELERGGTRAGFVAQHVDDLELVDGLLHSVARARP